MAKYAFIPGIDEVLSVQDKSQPLKNMAEQQNTIEYRFIIKSQDPKEFYLLNYWYKLVIIAIAVLSYACWMPRLLILKLYRQVLVVFFFI